MCDCYFLLRDIFVFVCLFVYRPTYAYQNQTKKTQKCKFTRVITDAGASVVKFCLHMSCLICLFFFELRCFAMKKPMTTQNTWLKPKMNEQKQMYVFKLGFVMTKESMEHRKFWMKNLQNFKTKHC